MNWIWGTRLAQIKNEVKDEFKLEMVKIKDTLDDQIPIVILISMLSLILIMAVNSIMTAQILGATLQATLLIVVVNMGIAIATMAGIRTTLMKRDESEYNNDELELGLDTKF